MRSAAYLFFTFTLATLAACGGQSTHEPPVKGDAMVNDDHPLEPAADDWPWWRGVGRDNVALNANPPLTWSESQNIIWKVDLPGEGHASPTVWGDRIFIAAADRDAGTQSLICYDRATGDKRWEKMIHHGDFISLHHDNSHASATPACDGEHVYTLFAIDEALFATAVSMDGDIVWQEKVGDFDPQWGYGSAPVLYRSMVIVNGDNDGPSYIAALDRQTGELVWRASRPDRDSYATPNVGQVAGRPQLVVHGGDMTTSYNPDTGEMLWHCEGPTRVTANTPALGDEHVYVSAGSPDRVLLAIRADGEGDVTDSHITWRDNSAKRNIPYVTSPLLHDGRLYIVSNEGVATNYDALTGDVIWRERLGRGIEFYASPVLAGEHLFACDRERGTTYVFKVGDTFELVATNELPSPIDATPAFCGDRIYLRTNEALYCIGEK